MEYERSVFRVHQKLISNNRCGTVLTITALVFLALAFVNFAILFSGHILYKNGTGVITAALKQYELEHESNGDVLPSIFIDPRDNTIQPKTGFTPNTPTQTMPLSSANKVTLSKLASKYNLTHQTLEQAIKNSTQLINKERKANILNPFYQILQHRSFIFTDLDVVNIHLVSNFSLVLNQSQALIPYSCITKETIYLHSYSLSNNANALKMYNEGFRDQIIHHEIFIDFKKFQNEISGLFKNLPVDDMVILDIINFFHQMNLVVTNRKSQEDWEWSREDLSQSRGLMAKSIILKLFQLVYVVIALITVSFASSVYTKIITFISPLWLYGFAMMGKTFL